MAGFIRRYGYFPGTEVITLIEGVIIVDLPPPGAVQGVGTGTVALIGEFADMTYAVSVDSTGTISTSPQPVEIFSGQDLLNKLGGFDETIGDTGISGGSGFIALRNKKFSRLIAVPINLASDKGVRVWRELPTNKSATNPTPVVPLVASLVSAGREFKTGSNRVRLAKSVTFTDKGHYMQGVDGTVVASGSVAATQTFSSSGSNFQTANGGVGVKAGDILVVGVLSASGAQGSNAACYRVAQDASAATTLTVEKMDGTTFDWTSGNSLAFRVHPASDADSGGLVNLANAAGYVIPARPLDATVSQETVVAPTNVPEAATASSWDPLSGLKMRTHPSGDLTYNGEVQGANAASAASMDALYDKAFDALLSEDLPAREVNLVVSARTSSTVRSKCKQHVLRASTQGMGRMTIVSPELTVQATGTVLGDSDPGVGANRNERVIYCWPGARTFVPEAVGCQMKNAAGLYSSDGILDTHLNCWMASLLSNLPPERNPGQGSAPVPEIMSPILGIQRGVTNLGMTEYIQFRQKGIAALRMDRTVGPIFQSGITTSLISGEKNIARRRFADFIQDSLAARCVQLAKQPLSNALKDAVVGEQVAFFEDLLSSNNPAAARIQAYQVDDKGGNTPDSEAKGIYVVISKVRMIPTADFIVIQSEVGENVKITAS